jgi:hypothetical protein
MRTWQRKGFCNSDIVRCDEGINSEDIVENQVHYTTQNDPLIAILYRDLMFSHFCLCMNKRKGDERGPGPRRRVNIMAARHMKAVCLLTVKQGGQKHLMVSEMN